MRKVIPYAVTAIVVAMMVWQRMTPDTTYMPDPVVELPGIDGMNWEEMEMSEAERETLPADTVIRRRVYKDAAGRWYQVSAVIGGRSKSSVHRPELCLPGQGYVMTDPHDMTAGDIVWRKLTLEKGGSGKVGFAYTFVNGTGFRTASHLVRILTDVWDRSVLGRIDRWVMLTVSSSCDDDVTLQAFLHELGEVVK